MQDECDLSERHPYLRGRDRSGHRRDRDRRATRSSTISASTVNPILLAGQVHGGVVQGIGQALTEDTVYGEDGQLLTASFMDYAMPRADDVPFFHFETRNVPSTTNALGIKGAGEAGTIGADAGGAERGDRRALPRLRHHGISTCRRRRRASGRRSRKQRERDSRPGRRMQEVPIRAGQRSARRSSTLTGHRAQDPVGGGLRRHVDLHQGRRHGARRADRLLPLASSPSFRSWRSSPCRANSAPR